VVCGSLPDRITTLAALAPRLTIGVDWLKQANAIVGFTAATEDGARKDLYVVMQSGNEIAPLPQINDGWLSLFRNVEGKAASLTVPGVAGGRMPN
jgi:hypothetical protein